MKRVIIVMLFILLSVTSNLTSFVYLESGETAVNIGLLSPENRSTVINVVQDEFDGVFVKEVESLSVLSFIIPEARFDQLTERLSEEALYVELDHLCYVPELPYYIDQFFFPQKSDGQSPGGESPFYYPNDPRYGQQWGPPAIDAQRAWNHVPQNHNVILAIIDTGVDVSHEDLVDNYDASIDKDIVNNDNNANDDMGHGTHCAGISAAAINNNIGVAGAAQVRIMGVKVLTWLGTGTDIDIADGITYASSNGADVISMSLGTPSYSSVVHTACDNAYNNNVVVIAAAGNSNTSQKAYPAAHSSVIGVAALETPTQLASFSNFGFDNVEISAPGVAIHSTLPDHSTFWNMFGIFPLDYGDMDGTSMACPLVAGVAAGYRAYIETLGAQTVRNLLNNWADDIGDPYYFGSGRVDYFPLDPEGSKSNTGSVVGDKTISGDPCTDTFLQFLRYRYVDVDVFDQNMDSVTSFRRHTENSSLDTVVKPLPAGEYYYRLRSGDKITSFRKISIH